MPQYESGTAGPAEADALLGPGAGLEAPVSEDVWSEQDTNPDAIEAALRDLLRRRHAENENLAPARVLNLVVILDRDWKGEISNRLERVGRYHASRTVVCAVEAGRDDARRDRDRQLRGPGPRQARGDPRAGRDRPRPGHLDALQTIVDPGARLRDADRRLVARTATTRRCDGCCR